jgi:hypothetical protein
MAGLLGLQLAVCLGTALRLDGFHFSEFLR